ncbi:FidL-like protein [Photobacterium lipolyticum]|uniref:FidL-like protein n=1 Tax=Photobacterium lipolyticum TaxID=266810 RepID=UPI001B87FD0F|nr:FidL-like protein [Photobacterium lipolyticum]
MQIKKSGKLFFFIALIALIFSLFPLALQKLPSRSGEMSCSTKAIMHFEDTVTESVNVNIHFRFGEKGKGSIVVEGYSDSKAGWLYLQRYVKFNYTSQRVSPTDRYYQINNWVAKKSSIDESPDVIFAYFMREMSDSHDDLLLKAKKMNEKTVLLSSLSSPLFICALKSGSSIN